MLIMSSCLLYTSDAADDMQCVDLGGRRIIKKKDAKEIYDLIISTGKNFGLTHCGAVSYTHLTLPTICSV